MAELALKTNAKQNTPPVSPVEGDVHIVGDSPSGGWAGKTADHVTVYRGGSWIDKAPAAGDRLYSMDKETFILFDGTDWLAEISPWSMWFRNSNATAVNSVRNGIYDSTTTTLGDLIAATEKVLVTACFIAWKSGNAASGTYSVQPYLDATGGDHLMTASTHTANSTETMVYDRQRGTIENPLITLTDERIKVVGWKNGSSSPGSLASANHYVKFLGTLMEIL